MNTSRSQPVTAQTSLATSCAEPSGPLKPSEVLSKAADLIEPEGWWNNDGEWLAVKAGHACYCAEAAIAHVEGLPVWAAFQRPPVSYLTRLLDIPDVGVPDWNDNPHRTQAEVVKALRDAAELARSEGQ